MVFRVRPIIQRVVEQSKTVMAGLSYVLSPRGKLAYTSSLFLVDQASASQTSNPTGSLETHNLRALRL